jgi:acyl-CoA synthetase (AMP-forming)/AMP-acid ligase II
VTTRRWELGDILREAVDRAAGHPALIVGPQRRRVSYGELTSAVSDLAGEMTRGGLLRGDVVALQASNTPQFVVALIAAARLGIVVAPLDPALPIVEKHRRVDAVGARVTLVDVDPSGVTDDGCPDWVVTNVPAGLPTRLRISISGPPRSAAVPAGLDDGDALIMMTSGTGGTPKLVPWTQHSLAASITAIAGGYGLSADDATVAVMPFFHGHGLVAGMLATLATGGTVLLPDRGRFSAHTFWDDVVAAGATWFTAVPTIYQILLNRAAPGGPDQAREFPALRFVRSCSAPLGADAAAGIESTFGTVVLAAYGMTETTHQASSALPSADAAARWHTVGTPAVVSVRVSTPERAAAEPGREGEIWLRGATVTRGYLGQSAQHSGEDFVDGWFRTGDLGLIDADGHLVVTGRIKNLINRGGEKVSPEHVEGVLLADPGIAEAAVVGVPDTVYGERVAAVVVTTGAAVLGSADVVDFCRTRLAPYEIPDIVIFTDDIPRTAKGDVDRAALPALLH